MEGEWTGRLIGSGGQGLATSWGGPNIGINPTPGGTAMQLSSWRDRRSGVGHLMGRDGSPQYQHQPNSRRDSNAAEFLEGQEGRGLATSWGGTFPPNISIDPTPGGTAMQLSSWKDRRSGVGHLMGRDVSPQYQHRPNSRKDRRSGVGHLMGRDVSPQYQHRPNSRKDRRSGVGHLMGRDVSPQYQHRPNSRREDGGSTGAPGSSPFFG